MLDRWGYWGLLLLIAAGALALRLPRLSARPMHNDEAVNTVKFNDLWQTKNFKYDPQEYHGPTLYYFTLPSVWLTRAADFAATTEFTYRIVPVVFGVALILLLPLLADGIGRGGVLWAALFTAVSPAFVFYSRYYIHEMLLVFFALAAVGCGWRYRRSGRLGWAIACGAAVALTYATKETWILGLAAAAASAVTAATIWRLLLKPVHHGLHFHGRALAAAALTFVLVFVLFFSSFFTDWRGPFKALGSYFHYAGRASGSIHDHSWSYYLQMLVWWRQGRGPAWTEAAIVGLAAVGFLLAVLRRHHIRQFNDAQTAASSGHPFSAFPPFVRFIAFYTLFLTVGFSVIPYKTPWCLLGFLHGMILLAGFACAQAVHNMPHWSLKGLAAAVFLLAAGHLAWEADRATNNFFAGGNPQTQRGRFEASGYNPYVYAHTGIDIFTLTRRMEEIATVSPKHHGVEIEVVTADCWPIPFYLRTFANTGYLPQPPDRYQADVVIGTEDARERMNAPDAKRKYATAGSFGLRPGVVLWIYVDESLMTRLRDLWQSSPRTR